jgi:hypothetical protein
MRPLGKETTETMRPAGAGNLAPVPSGPLSRRIHRKRRGLSPPTPTPTFHPDPSHGVAHYE